MTVHSLPPVRGNIKKIGQRCERAACSLLFFLFFFFFLFFCVFPPPPLSRLTRPIISYTQTRQTRVGIISSALGLTSKVPSPVCSAHYKPTAAIRRCCVSTSMLFHFLLLCVASRVTLRLCLSVKVEWA